VTGPAKLEIVGNVVEMIWMVIGDIAAA